MQESPLALKNHMPRVWKHQAGTKSSKDSKMSKSPKVLRASMFNIKPFVPPPPNFGRFSARKQLKQGQPDLNRNKATQAAETVSRCACPKVLEQGKWMCEFAARWLKSIEDRTDTAIDYTAAENIFHRVLKKDKEVDHKVIARDVERTFNENPYFSSAEGKKSLKDLLTAICKHSSSVGYTQGLNSFAAGVMWHSGEILAFEIVLRAMNNYHLKEVHMPRVPGLFHHSEVLQVLVKENLPELSRLFDQN